jgi:hypothetical protein
MTAATSASPVEASASDPGWKRACGLLALFAIVFGARLWIVNVCGSPLPVWDQWDAEGYGLFKPFLRGELPLSHLFQSHNEHRIVLTRLLALGLFQMNGMWDTRLEMVVNAAIAAGSATLIAHLLLVEIGATWWRPVVSMVALLWALPYGWENTTWGFQSQVYLLVLFSFLALWGSFCCLGLFDHGFRASCGVGGCGNSVFGDRSGPENVADTLANVAGLLGVRHHFLAAHPALVPG